MVPQIEINGRVIARGRPTYIVAEISANHHQRLNEAVELLHAAREAGADAVKLQTYTPDSLTIRSDTEYFTIRGTAWDRRHLYDLYEQAYMPWEWHEELFAVGRRIGLEIFSTPFDAAAVELLDRLGSPAHKVASFELVDIPLIERIARTGKPMIVSTGMATLSEIDEAVAAARGAGAKQLVLLKCNSGYPAPPEEMNLTTIPHMAETFGVPVGLSDHTVGISAAVAAVALGACLIEKHFTLSRAAGGPDSAFSIEPAELKALVEAVRTAEQSLGTVSYGPSESERPSRRLRRSLFVVEDIRAGEELTERNVRSIRPADGLHPRHFPDVLGKKAARDVSRGTPLEWSLIAPK